MTSRSVDLGSSCLPASSFSSGSLAMVFLAGPSDPFYELMHPPLDETSAQKTARQKQELDAQRISDSIDEEIKQERAKEKSKKDVINVLLLGQAESGKSTTLKNLRMRYARAEWEKERNGWRSVVQLNVVRSIITIQNVIEAEMNGDAPPETEDELAINDDNEIEVFKFTDHHQLLMIRLAPLVRVEAELRHRLGAGSELLPTFSNSMSATPFDAPYSNQLRELSVPSWKDVLDPSGRPGELSPKTADSVTSVLAGCKDDMKALWDDKAVRLALKRRRLQLPDSAGFFLNDLDRIASWEYSVTDDDIVRARLKTVGIQEHRLIFSDGAWNNPLYNKHDGWEWRIFDVGGCRTLRSAWQPYFENVNVIIFLSPVSVFDQRLEEDNNVNRLDDSITLWTSICSSKLLAKTQLILFLNKCDLLRRKLKRGIKVNKYHPSFGDRPNEVMTVVKYLRGIFRDIQKRSSPEQRSVYIYPTTMTDTRATATTLDTVRDGVLQKNLASSHII